jgi:hypothetical protein
MATAEELSPLRYASVCAFLRVTLDSRQPGGLSNLCTHIVRDGMSCIGPFLDDHETTCGFWELKPGAVPQPMGEHPPAFSRVYAPQSRASPNEDDEAP